MWYKKTFKKKEAGFYLIIPPKKYGFKNCISEIKLIYNNLNNSFKMYVCND